MNKKIYITLGIILMTAIVSAYTIGQIINQEQLDNINIDNIQFDIEVNDIIKQDGSVFVYFNFTTLKDLKNNTYEIVLKERQVACPIRVYTNCRSEGETKEECVKVIKNYLKDKIRKLKIFERRRIEKWQTEIVEEELLVSDLDLGDLN